MPATAAPVEQHWRTGRCGVQREPGALQRSHAGWELSNTGTKLAEICSSRAPPQPADYVAQPAIWLLMPQSYKASVMPCSRHQHLSHRRANNYLTLISSGAQQSTRITAKTAQTKQYPSPGTRPTTSQIYRMDVAYQKPCSNFSHVLSHDINHVLKEEVSKEAPSLCQHLAFRKATTICCSVRQVTEHFDLDAVASSRSRFPLRFRY